MDQLGIVATVYIHFLWYKNGQDWSARAVTLFPDIYSQQSFASGEDDAGNHCNAQCHINVPFT